MAGADSLEKKAAFNSQTMKMLEIRKTHLDNGYHKQCGHASDDDVELFAAEEAASGVAVRVVRAGRLN